MFQKRLTCTCEQCQNDIMALTLNRLPSRYVSTELGSAYVKAQYLNSQLQSDVIRELTLAVDKVGQQPKHTVTVTQPSLDKV